MSLAIQPSYANSVSNHDNPITAESVFSSESNLRDLVSNSVASAPKTYASTAPAVDGLPAGMNQELYEKTIDYGKLSAQAYDWDDEVAAQVGMKLFGGIRDITKTTFETPGYSEDGPVIDALGLGPEGGWIDWWGQEGLDYKVFEDVNSGDITVAFKGTEPLSLVDWVEDVEQAMGSSEQYEQAVGFARDLSTQIDQYNADNNLTGDDAIQLSFTGHSLGGGLATACSLATGREAIAFDAAGVSNKTIANLGLDLNNADKITNINVQGDWLSDANGNMDDLTLGNGVLSETKQYGETFWLEGINDRADFGGWLVSDRTPTARLAESILNHAWHVYTYQLENKNFV